MVKDVLYNMELNNLVYWRQVEETVTLSLFSSEKIKSKCYFVKNETYVNIV